MSEVVKGLDPNDPKWLKAEAWLSELHTRQDSQKEMLLRLIVASGIYLSNPSVANRVEFENAFNSLRYVDLITIDDEY